jgi:uncharacterized membrane protein
VKHADRTKTPQTQRLTHIDLLRGAAIALMVAFHFSYDLSHFGFAAFDFHNDPFWLHARTFILSLFLLLVGISLVLSTRHGVRLRSMLKRLGLIVGCAALISLSSYLMFGPRWIFFGVLHFIALASVIGPPFVRMPWLALLLGMSLITLDRLFSSAVFDQNALQWIGLMTHKPPTEDYVPLIPWLGVVLIGIFLACILSSKTQPAWIQRLNATRPARWLAFAGRHSLLIYMLHQPLLIGILQIVKIVSD